MIILIIISVILLAVWLIELLLLNRTPATVQSATPSGMVNVNYDDTSVLSVSESFIACREKFESTPDYSIFRSFCKDEYAVVLSESQKEAVKRSLYLSFCGFRPYLSGFNGKLNETELFCFVLTLMNVGNRHIGELLNMSESSVRSCKTRLKGKLERESLRLFSSDVSSNAAPLG